MKSGPSSPESNMSGPSVVRSGSTYVSSLGTASPTTSSQSAPAAQNISSSVRQMQPMAYDHQSAEGPRHRQSSNPGRRPMRYDNVEAEDSATSGPPPGPLDPRLIQGPANPLESPRRSSRVSSVLQQGTSDSSKSSVVSTWSGGSTASSSILPPSLLDEPKKTGLSLPPLVAVTSSSRGGTLASAKPIASRPKSTLPSGRTAPSEPMQRLSETISDSSFIGMKFESLQLRLPYNISFGQRPLPRPEH